MILQNYNITCHPQEAGVILHMHTNILEYVTTQQVKTNNVPALNYSTLTLLVVIKSLRHNIIPFHRLLLVFCFLLFQNSSFLLHELDDKSDQNIEISRNFLPVKMVSENMKSLPMMHIIG